MAWMNPRRLHSALEQRLDEVPAVTLLGPRQVGKATLALEVGEARNTVYLRSGLYFLLGSVALDLPRPSGETLAGRVSTLELHPCDALEVDAAEGDRLWLRGGFPESFGASSDARSLRWRLDFVRS